MKKISSGNKSSKQTNTKIVARRAAIFLTLILGLFITTTVSAAFVGYKSGEIEEKIVNPIKSAVSSTVDSFVEAVTYRPSPPPAPKINTTRKSPPPTNQNSNAVQSTPKTVKTQTTTKTQYQAPAFNQGEWQKSVDKMNQDAQAKYQQSVQDQQEWFNQAKKEAAQNQADWAAQNQADLEKWKAEHGF